MPITNFPQGVSSFGFPLMGAGPLITSGKVFWVSSVSGRNSPDYGSSPETPFASIVYAVTKCVTNRGDMIVVMPLHQESITAAGTLTISKNGISVVGLGNPNVRPSINFSALVGATVAVSGVGVSFQNVTFNYAGIDAITTGVNITGTDANFIGCFFRMGNAGAQATRAVTLSAAAANALFRRCRFSFVDAGATHCIYTAGAVDNLTVEECVFVGDCTTAAIHNDTAAATNLVIINNLFRILGTGKSVVVHAAATGIIANNHTQITANIVAGGSMTAAACLKSNNLAQETAGIAASTVVDPAGGAIV